MIDLHVHSGHSRDARGTVQELAEAARAKGLLGFALTDHDTTEGHRHIKEAAKATGRLIIPGVETTTAEGHLLALGVDRAPPRGLGLAETLDLVHDLGGLGVAAHPLRFLTGIGPHGLRERTEAGVLHAAEARNARERALVQHNTERLCRDLGLSLTGGSDAHWVRDIGTAYTAFDEPPVTADDVLEAIRRGRCKGEGTALTRRSVLAHQVQLVGRRLRR